MIKKILCIVDAAIWIADLSNCQNCYEPKYICITNLFLFLSYIQSETTPLKCFSRTFGKSKLHHSREVKTLFIYVYIRNKYLDYATFMNNGNSVTLRMKSSSSSSKYSQLPTSSSKKSKSATSCSCWKLTIQILIISSFLILAVLGVIGFANSRDIQKQLSLHRYCIFMRGSNLFEAGLKDDNGLGVGYVTVDTGSNKLVYEFLYEDISTPQALHICGPSTEDSVGVSNVFIPDDSSSLSIASTTNLIKGSIAVSHDKLEQIISNPTYYYISLKTTEFPTGAIGARLGMSC